MITYSVVKAVEGERYFDGRTYAHLDDGRMVQLLGEVDGREYALLMTCGSALRAKADREAEYLGGEVVTVESQYWPGSTAILAAIAEAQTSRAADAVS